MSLFLSFPGASYCKNSIFYFRLLFRLFWPPWVHCNPASFREDHCRLLENGLGARVQVGRHIVLYWQSRMSAFLASNHGWDAVPWDEQTRRANEADPSWGNWHLCQESHQAQPWDGNFSTLHTTEKIWLRPTRQYTFEFVEVWYWQSFSLNLQVSHASSVGSREVWIFLSPNWPQQCSPLSTVFDLIKVSDEEHQALGGGPIITVDR